MKAIVQNGYGNQEVFALKEVEKPVVGESDVLVQVRAASVNAGDTFIMRGHPWLVRLSFGLNPKDRMLGWDVAGRVEAVGGKVKRFRPGDEVFGSCNNAFAEYVAAKEDLFALKPSNLTFEQAAAVPTAALTALQCLRKKRLGPGHSVLINGASGGVGHFAVQIGKASGAEVTGVCSTRNVDMVRSLGADHVVDYTREDFASGGKQYDLILDNVANRKLKDLRRALKPDGLHVPNSGHGGMSYVFKAALLSVFMRKHGGLAVMKVNHEDLMALKELIESGKLKPVIDRTYPFAKTPEAIAYVGGAHARGKVVVVMEQAA